MKTEPRPFTTERRGGNPPRWISFLLLFALFCVLCCEANAAEPVALAGQARALLQEKCLVCHGDDAAKIKGGYDMRTRDGLMRGGESGDAAIVPHEPEKSPLWLAVTRRDEDFAMPPKASERLSPEQVELLKKWILEGAAWAETGAVKPAGKWSAADGLPVKTSGGQSAEWTEQRYQPGDLWAYQPVKP